MESKICYICFEPETDDTPFAKNPRPCSCKGSIEIHTKCLEKVIKTNARTCSICKVKYNIKYLPTKHGLELKIEYRDGYVLEYTLNANGQKHGSCCIRSDDGILLEQQTYTNGIANGIFAKYYPSGKIHTLCRCVNNKIEGEYTRWFEDGGIMEEAFYVDGLKQGECTKWVKKNGVSILATYHYENGYLVSSNYV